MNLHVLSSTAVVTISYDSTNDWLFVDWEGYLTLANVQAACVALATCFVQRAYPRVLNSNVLITGIDWQVAPWLAEHFLPYLSLAGVEQLAWVWGPTLRGRDMAEQMAQRQPLLALALFEDLEQAVQWLHQEAPEYVSACAMLGRPATVQALLEKSVEAFTRRITGQACSTAPAQ